MQVQAEDRHVGEGRARLELGCEFRLSARKELVLVRAELVGDLAPPLGKETLKRSLRRGRKRGRRLGLLDATDPFKERLGVAGFGESNGNRDSEAFAAFRVVIGAAQQCDKDELFSSETGLGDDVGVRVDDEGVVVSGRDGGVLGSHRRGRRRQRRRLRGLRSRISALSLLARIGRQSFTRVANDDELRHTICQARGDSAGVKVRLTEGLPKRNVSTSSCGQSDVNQYRVGAIDG
jgi:hypothetical protein